MNGLIRGTTPSIRFTYSDISVADITVAYLTIKQLGAVLVEKELADATVGDDYLQWTLTQEETLSLKQNSANVDVQCRFKLSDGSAGASPVYSMPALKILKEGEI